jgi:hypothetical protein
MVKVNSFLNIKPIASNFLHYMAPIKLVPHLIPLVISVGMSTLPSFILETTPTILSL